MKGSVAATAGGIPLSRAISAWDSEAGDSQPGLVFPSEPRQRIAIASYPFRDFIAGNTDAAGARKKMELKDFAAHVAEKFNIRKIEPWSEHFRSLDPTYLEEIRRAAEKARGAIVNIAVDGHHSPYAADESEREKSVILGERWVDAAVILGCPSIRTSMAPARDSEPNAERAAESLTKVVEYASRKNVVVCMENDNPVSEDPFFVAKVIEKVNSPWLHALPDFANSLVTGREEYAYDGIKQMFAHAFNICHVKALEVNDKGQTFSVDMGKTFGIMKNAKYKGYCSMEYDSPGDPYKGTASLVESTLRYLY